MIGRAKVATCIAVVLTILIAGFPWPRPDAQASPTPWSDIASATNDFGLRLLRALTDGKGGNVIISPLSVSLALDMTYNGAAGETKTAMAKTLGLELLSGDMNQEAKWLLAMIRNADPKIQLEIANALWAQSDFSIDPDFLRLSRDYYDASVENLDFAHDPESAGKKINRWVDGRTHGKIPTIIGTPKRNTALILTDAVYFKGRWSVPFDRKRTEPRAFHLRGGASPTVPMMIQDGEYDYLENDSFQAIRLPYGNSRLAMYVFLPRKNYGLSDFMKSLDRYQWNELRVKFGQDKGKIILPRFELAYSSQLKDSLKTMGMSIAFKKLGADFSRIHPPPPSLYIDDVEHKTYVKVDEEGTEAAAATSVTMDIATIAVVPPHPFQMIVDHPFFFTIIEQPSGAMLFAGVVTDPSRH